MGWLLSMGTPGLPGASIVVVSVLGDISGTYIIAKRTGNVANKSMC